MIYSYFWHFLCFLLLKCTANFSDHISDLFHTNQICDFARNLRMIHFYYANSSWLLPPKGRRWLLRRYIKPRASIKLCVGFTQTPFTLHTPYAMCLASSKFSFLASAFSFFTVDCAIHVMSVANIKKLCVPSVLCFWLFARKQTRFSRVHGSPQPT